MSISSYASDLSAASHSHSCEITQSTPSLCRRVPCRKAGRHVPGVAVDRCLSFGVVRAGSVLLPGLGMVDRWV
eukprot:scaffold24310_cov113-Isochrysis_galbana.AAC.4